MNRYFTLIISFLNRCTKRVATHELPLIDVGTKYISPVNICDAIQSRPAEQVKQIVRNFSTGVDLMIINCNGDMNVGMMLRNAFVFGVSRVWIVGRRKFDTRFTVGAHHYLLIQHVAHVDSEFFKLQNMTPVLVEQGGKSVYQVKWKPLLAQNICLVMGNEHHGIDPNLLLAFPKQIISIPQTGWTRSLNVGVASAVILSEIQRYMLHSISDP